MSGSSKKFNYTVAKVMHWAAGLVIGFNLLSGWRLGGFDLAVKQVLLMIHSGVGTVVFLVMVFRWWWRRAHDLYAPPRWWRRPSMLVQWVFYPLLLVQVGIGVAVAAVIDYEVLGFGFIPYSAIAADNPALQGVFLNLHAVMAWLLIALVVVHGIERWRLIFVDDVGPVDVRQPAKP